MVDATVTRELNGVDVERLRETIEHVKQRPDLGDFRFRLENRWISGGRNRSEIRGFYGAGEDRDGRHHTVEADEPPLLLGGD